MVGRYAEGGWVDLLLFSPTHGYTWLTYENGHYTFARRTRTCLGSEMWTQALKLSVECGEQRFRLYERYEAEITYVAGELTWLAQVGDRSTVAEAIAPPWLLSAEKTLEVTQPERLVALELDTSLSNAWLYFEITLLHDNEEVYAIGKEVSYYEGYEDGESWTEGSRSATALFKVPAAGQYTLQVETPEGGEGESAGNPPQGSVTLEVREGFVSTRYFLLLALLSGVASLWHPVARWWFERRRWQETEEDDD
jgi:hypothetical protein